MLTPLSQYRSQLYSHLELCWPDVLNSQPPESRAALDIIDDHLRGFDIHLSSPIPWNALGWVKGRAWGDMSWERWL